jgi:hypothetical protein
MKRKPLSILVTLVFGALLSSYASAVVFLEGSFTTSSNNVPYQTYEARGGSGSIAFGLGQYLRLGYTHRQDYKGNEGYNATVSGDTVTFSYFINKTTETSNSLDLTIILYAGETFVPYLLAGGVVKRYDVAITQNNETRTGSYPNPLEPNLGAGLGFRLNQEFTLKFQYLVSPGKYQEPGGEEIGVWDRYSEVGLTYELF